MAGARALDVEQGEDAQFAGDAAKFRNRGLVEGQVELGRIEQQEVGRERQVETIVRDGQRRQGRVQVAPGRPPRRVVLEENRHGGQAGGLQARDIAVIAPDETRAGGLQPVQHDPARRLDPAGDLLPRKAVGRVGGDNVMAQAGHLGGEAGGPAGYVEDPCRGCEPRQVEEGLVFLAVAAPGQGLLELEFAGHSGVRRARGRAARGPRPGWPGGRRRRRRARRPGPPARRCWPPGASCRSGRCPPARCAGGRPAPAPSG